MTEMKIKKGTKVKWPTNGRWGARTKSGVVVGFVKRNASAKRALSEAERKAFVGSDKNTVNDRYLVRLPDGHITAPRAPTLERSTKS